MDDDCEITNITTLNNLIEPIMVCVQLFKNCASILSSMRALLITAAEESNKLDRIEQYHPPSAAVFLSIKFLIIFLAEHFNVTLWV